MRSFVLSGVNNFHNRGVEALVTPIVVTLSHRYPGCHITVLARHYGDMEARLSRYGAVAALPDPFRTKATYGLAKLGLLHVVRLLLVGPRFAAARRALRCADALLVTGGDNFGEEYGSYDPYLAPMLEANALGVPVVLFANSYGPLRDGPARQRFVDACRASALITTRETMSQGYLVETLGITEPMPILTGDVGFLLEPASADVRRAALEEIGIGDHPYCVFNLSGGIAAFSGLDGDRHTRDWAQVIAKLRRKIRLPILLLPHVWDRTRPNRSNDLSAIDAALAHLETRDDLHVLRSPQSADGYKALIGGARFLVAERMHAAIAGLSQGIPTVAISYSVKADGIIGDLFSALPANRRPVIPVSDIADPDRAAARILSLYAERDTLAATLFERVPLMKQRALENFELLDRVIAAPGCP